jgi:alpha-tubulin suppressor-like RCC1 family protein
MDCVQTATDQPRDVKHHQTVRLPSLCCSSIPAVAVIKSWEAGPANLLVLYTDGSVRCTGANFSSQCSLPDADKLSVGEGITDLAMGAFHGNAVVNGRVEPWGNPFRASTNNVPEDARTGVIDVASGAEHNIAVKRINASATRLIRWGDTRSELGTVPDRSDVVAVSAGLDHVLALTTSGGVLHWGESRFGQGAVPLEAASGIVAIAAGTFHSMALTSSGRVLAWGGTDGQSNVPVEAQSDVIKIAAKSRYCLALRRDGRVIAWGDYAIAARNGANVSPEFQAVPTTPSDMDSGVVDIAALDEGFVARKLDGSVVTFGQPRFGVFSFPVVI